MPYKHKQFPMLKKRFNKHFKSSTQMLPKVPPIQMKQYKPTILAAQGRKERKIQSTEPGEGKVGSIIHSQKRYQNHSVIHRELDET